MELIEIKLHFVYFLINKSQIVFELIQCSLYKFLGMDSKSTIRIQAVNERIPNDNQGQRKNVTWKS